MPERVAGILVVGAFVAGLLSNDEFRRTQRRLYRQLERTRKNLRKGLYKNRRT